MRSRLTTTLLPLVFCIAVFTRRVFAGQEPAPAPALAQSAGERGSDAVRQLSSLPFSRTELFFGTNRPDGDGLPRVSEEEFRGFLDPGNHAAPPQTA